MPVSPADLGLSRDGNFQLQAYSYALYDISLPGTPLQMYMP